MMLIIRMGPRHWGQVRGSTFPDQVRDRLLSFESMAPNLGAIGLGVLIGLQDTRDETIGLFFLTKSPGGLALEAPQKGDRLHSESRQRRDSPGLGMWEVMAANHSKASKAFSCQWSLDGPSRGKPTRTGQKAILFHWNDFPSQDGSRSFPKSTGPAGFPWKRPEGKSSKVRSGFCTNWTPFCGPAHIPTEIQPGNLDMLIQARESAKEVGWPP